MEMLLCKKIILYQEDVLRIAYYSKDKNFYIGVFSDDYVRNRESRKVKVDKIANIDVNLGEKFRIQTFPGIHFHLKRASTKDTYNLMAIENSQMNIKIPKNKYVSLF